MAVIRRLDEAGEVASSYRIAQEWVEPPQFLDERLGRLVAAGWLAIQQTAGPPPGDAYYVPGPKAPQ